MGVRPEIVGTAHFGGGSEIMNSCMLSWGLLDVGQPNCIPRICSHGPERGQTLIGIITNKTSVCAG